ncbi:MAG: hypothetical protein QXO76_01245 [Thermoproteota archaeon]
MSSSKLDGFKEVTTNEVEPMIINNILFSAYGRNPEVDERIREYLSKNFVKVDLVSSDRALGMALVGFPGEGKTTVVKRAAQKAAEIMGLRFCFNPPNSDEITEKDFVMTVIELSGEVSNSVITGLPITEKRFDGNVVATTYAPPDQILACSRAGAAVVLLDDALNAPGNIQNICLSLMEEKRYRNIDLGRHAYVCLTGNLGSIDGTYATRMSTALLTRSATLLVRDTVNNWINRSAEEFGPKPGADGLVKGFLEANLDMFHVPKPDKRVPYPCPREWTKFAKRSAPLTGYLVDLAMEGQLIPNEVMEKVMNEVSFLAYSTVGQEAALKFMAYLRSYFSRSLTLAMSAFKSQDIKIDAEGKFSASLDQGVLKAIEKEYGEGLSASQQEFGVQYANALAEIAALEVNKLVSGNKARTKGSKEPSRELIEVYGRFAHALLTPSFHEDIITKCMGHFVNKLSAYDRSEKREGEKRVVIPAMSSVTGAKHVGMNEEHLKAITLTFRVHPKALSRTSAGLSLYNSAIVSEVVGMMQELDDLLNVRKGR